MPTRLNHHHPSKPCKPKSQHPNLLNRMMFRSKKHFNARRWHCNRQIGHQMLKRTLRDRIAMEATEKDIKAYTVKGMTRAEARYAFADDMIKTRRANNA